jgi:Flp pilus assembly protein TadG
MMRRRRRSERGTNFVEMALVVPLLLTLMLGIFQVGMMFRSDIAIANATRTAARTGSTAGKAPTADFQILSSLSAALGSVKNATVNYVVIYKVTGSTNAVPAACTSAAAIAAHGNAANFCNTYSAADLSAILANPVSAQTSYGGSCAGAGKDTKWCPTTRVVDQGATNGPDYLGVAISLTVPTFTRLVGTTKTFNDRFTMRLDPSGLG